MNMNLFKKKDKKKKISKVFVYGLLRVGERLATQFDRFRTGAEPASVTGTLLDLEDFTGLIEVGDTIIEGELQAYGKRMDKVMRMMDGVEGYCGKDNPINLFIRDEVDVTLKDGSIERAYIYYFNVDLLKEES